MGGKGARKDIMTHYELRVAVCLVFQLILGVGPCTMLGGGNQSASYTGGHDGRKLQSLKACYRLTAALYVSDFHSDQLENHATEKNCEPLLA